MAVDSLGTPIGQTTTSSAGLSGLGQQYLTPLLDKAAQQLQTPYQAYGGQRVAGTSDLQNQALGGIAGLQAFNPTEFHNQNWNDPNVAQSFISPYSSAVTDIAAREAQRKFDTQKTQLGQAGAESGFGDRFRLVQAENERNNAQQQNDIRTKGLQDAYTAGQNQFNTQNLLGFQTQLAQNNANLQGYNTGINNLDTQLRAGALPRDINQANLDVGYQNYQTQQAYPWKQIQNAQQAFSGIPMTSSTQRTDFASPSALSQGIGIGTIGLGLNKLGAFDGLGSLFKGWMS
jgi:hypothetical protein